MIDQARSRRAIRMGLTSIEKYKMKTGKLKKLIEVRPKCPYCHETIAFPQTVKEHVKISNKPQITTRSRTKPKNKEQNHHPKVLKINEKRLMENM